MRSTRVLAVLLVAALSTCAAAAAAAGAKPNVVVILADDFGYGSVGCYGASGVETPHLDRLAREGRRFTHAYAPGSVCSPTRYGMLTGRYYWRTATKDGKVIPGNAPLHIETNRLTLASLCRDQGYRTAAFGKWHLGMTDKRVTDWSVPLRPGPLQVGFDHFFGMAANLGNGPHSFIRDEAVTGRIEGEPVVVQPGKQTSGVKEPWQSERVMETLTKHVTGWIEANRGEPFLVYFAPNAVHEPIVPRAEFAGTPLGRYGDFIRELDWSVGEILGALDRLKLSDDTLVIFTSDNGGVVNPGNPNASAAIRAGLAINGPLRGGKHSEFEGGFRVPFLVRWPGKVPAGTVSEQVVCLTDLPATFAELFQAPLPAGSAEDSFDVYRALLERKPGPPVRDHVIVQSADAIYAIRVGDWKFIERQDAPEFESTRNPRKAEQQAKKRARRGADELFNLKDDPGETRDVLAANKDRAAAMKRMLVEARERGFTRPRP